MANENSSQFLTLQLFYQTSKDKSLDSQTELKIAKETEQEKKGIVFFVPIFSTKIPQHRYFKMQRFFFTS